MNSLEKSIVSSVTGTTMMTLFSYGVSLAEKENFSEPEHLGTLIRRLSLGKTKKEAEVAGWVLHYLIGLLFVLIYKRLWLSGKVKKTLENGILLGLITGFLGSVVWQQMLKNHPSPPRINFTKYLMQLIPAHVVFAVCTTLIDRLLDDLPKASKSYHTTDISFQL